MQMSSVKILVDSVLPFICVCLLAVLSWKLFLVLSSILRLLSIHAPTQHLEESVSDHPNARNVSRRKRDQFLAALAARNECNYVGSVPLRRPKPNSVDSIVKHLIEETLLEIEFCLMNFASSFEHLRRIPDDYVAVEMIENTERGMDSRPSENANDVNKRNENSPFVFVEDQDSSLNHEQTSVNEVTSSMIEVKLEEIRALSKLPDGTERAAMKDSGTGEEDRACSGNGSGSGNQNQTDIENQMPYSSMHAASLEIATGGEPHLANSEKKFEEGPETTATRYLAEKFLISILEESLAFRTNSKELLSGRTIDQEKEDERSPPKEGDYPVDEQFGVDPEKEANRTEGESVMHSSKDATQSPAAESEGVEEVGPDPETSSLKNGRGTESTISLARPAATRAKEEEDLNAIIRSMIITELRRHRKKEQRVLKRAHSDTESVLPKKRHDENRIGLFSVKGRTFFRDLLELEESLRKGIGNVSEKESTETGLLQTIVDRQDAEEDEKSSRNEANAVLVDRSTILSMTTVHKANSNILLERKVNVPCLMDVEESIEPVKTTVHESRMDKCTQTEHVYVIRSVRSCPLRKRRLPAQYQMHKIAAIRDAVYSKTVYANLDYSRFIFRKASDNLIYEKGKASRSPSYVPAPERYRWKYLTPTKVK